MSIPFTAGAMIELHEANPTFDKPSSEQAVAAKDRRFLFVESIEFTCLRRFLGEIHDARCLGLHAKCQFVRLNPSFQFTLIRSRRSVGSVEFIQVGQLRSLPLVADV